MRFPILDFLARILIIILISLKMSYGRVVAGVLFLLLDYLELATPYGVHSPSNRKSVAYDRG